MQSNKRYHKCLCRHLLVWPYCPLPLALITSLNQVGLLVGKKYHGYAMGYIPVGFTLVKEAFESIANGGIFFVLSYKSHRFKPTNFPF